MAADIQAALVAYLQTKGEVTNLLGNPPRTRLYPEFAPPDAIKPYATYTLQQDDRPLCHSGRAGFGTARVQIDVWGAGAEQGHKQANEVYLALWGTSTAPVLDGYRGYMGGVFVQRSQCSDGAKNSPGAAAQGKVKPDATCSLVVTLWFDDLT